MSRLFAIAAALPILTFAACSSFSPATRNLAPTEQVMKHHTPRPLVRVGDDLGVVAAQAFAYGDANACKVEQNWCARDAEAASLAAGKSVPSSAPACAPTALKAFCDRPGGSR